MQPLCRNLFTYNVTSIALTKQNVTSKRVFGITVTETLLCGSPYDVLHVVCLSLTLSFIQHLRLGRRIAESQITVEYTI